MKIYTAEKLPGIPTNDVIVEHGLRGGIHGVQTRCIHYTVDDETGRYSISRGLALELRGRYDCAQVPPPTARHKVVF